MGECARVNILKTPSSLGPEQTVNVYDTPLAEEDLNCAIIREDADLTEDERKYKESIFIPNWQETLLVLERDAVIDPRDLRFSTATSYHLQAVRKGQVHDILPVSVIAVLITADGKLVTGVRKGRMAGGQIHVSPAGYANIRQRKSPIFGSLYEELREELGIGEEDVMQSRLLAHESDPNSKGIDFVILLRTTWRASQIKELHEQAVAPYRAALERGIPELEARKAIEAAGFTNVDAWEHSELLFLDDDEERLQATVDDRSVAHQGQRIPLVDACRGAIMAYLEHRRSAR